MPGAGARARSSASRATEEEEEAPAPRRPHKVVNQVFGTPHGQFTTRGHYATAADEGTGWRTSDRCDGTQIAVTAGKVTRDRLRPPPNDRADGRAPLPRAAEPVTARHALHSLGSCRYHRATCTTTPPSRRRRAPAARSRRASTPSAGAARSSCCATAAGGQRIVALDAARADRDDRAQRPGRRRPSAGTARSRACTPSSRPLPASG